MHLVKPKFITDKKGRKVSVVIRMKEFKTILEELEELGDIRLFDQAKKTKVESLPIDKAFKVIEKKRRAKS